MIKRLLLCTAILVGQQYLSVSAFSQGSGAAAAAEAAAVEAAAAAAKAAADEVKTNTDKLKQEEEKNQQSLKDRQQMIDAINAKKNTSWKRSKNWKTPNPIQLISL
jgi:ABC-type transporter MlaC component